MLTEKGKKVVALVGLTCLGMCTVGPGITLAILALALLVKKSGEVKK